MICFGCFFFGKSNFVRYIIPKTVYKYILNIYIVDMFELELFD